MAAPESAAEKQWTTASASARRRMCSRRPGRSHASRACACRWSTASATTTGGSKAISGGCSTGPVICPTAATAPRGTSTVRRRGEALLETRPRSGRPTAWPRTRRPPRARSAVAADLLGARRSCRRAGGEIEQAGARRGRLPFSGPVVIPGQGRAPSGTTCGSLGRIVAAFVALRPRRRPKGSPAAPRRSPWPPAGASPSRPPPRGPSAPRPAPAACPRPPQGRRASGPRAWRPRSRPPPSA